MTEKTFKLPPETRAYMRDRQRAHREKMKKEKGEQT
jgi:hypothetical protein